MGGPSGDYVQAIRQLADDRGLDVNVYEAAPAQLQVPAIVVVPDSPWLAIAADQTFGSWAEGYLAICVAAAGDPVSAKDQLRQLIILARDAAELELRSWRFVEASGIGPAEDAGIIYLASTVKVTHNTED
jgi:hypothetical protein